MQNFATKIEDSTEEQLKHSINEHNPHFASLSSDELTRRSLDKLQKSFTDFDKSTSKFSTILGVFALIQIFIAGLQLILDIETYPNKVLSVSFGVIFILIIFWIFKQVNKIIEKK